MRTLLSKALILFIIAFCLVKEGNSNEYSTIFLLMNDNSIYKGQIIGFEDGFIFLKKSDHILRISPNHFKGIFQNSKNAENAIIIIDEQLNSVSPGKHTDTYTLIYKKAGERIDAGCSKDQLTTHLQELTNSIHSPKDLLKIELYKELLIVSCLAYDFGISNKIEDLIHNLPDITESKQYSDRTKELIKIKIKTIEYLLNHPYIKE